MSTYRKKKYRGPSRSVDPRRVPRPVKRRGPDMFGMMLIGGLGAFIIIVIIFIATQTGTTATTPPTTSSNPAAALTGLVVNQNPPTDATQQAIQYATATAKEPHISAAEAVSLAATKSPTIIDVRETTRYQASHVRGARNVPYNEAQTRLSEFPKLGDLILYCQWPADEESASVAFLLRSNGYANYRILKGGLDAWTAAGGAVEGGNP